MTGDFQKGELQGFFGFFFVPLREHHQVTQQTAEVEEQKLIERKYFIRESTRSIAQELGASEKSVESRLGRLRAKIRQGILSQLRYENSER